MSAWTVLLIATAAICIDLASTAFMPGGDDKQNGDSITILVILWLTASLQQQEDTNSMLWSSSVFVTLILKACWTKYAHHRRTLERWQRRLDTSHADASNAAKSSTTTRDPSFAMSLEENPVIVGRRSWGLGCLSNLQDDAYRARCNLCNDTPNVVSDLLSSLIYTLWTLLLVETVVPNATASDAYAWGTGVAVFLVCWFRGSRRHRGPTWLEYDKNGTSPRQVDTTIYYEPSTSSVVSQRAARRIDESRWSEWTSSQVLEWMIAVVASDEQLDNASGSYENEETVSYRLMVVLGPHRIAGRQLEQLVSEDTFWSTISTLLPLGVAMSLRPEIKRLTSQYPAPKDENDTERHSYSNTGGISGQKMQSTRPSNANSWLAQHDREYNNASTLNVSATQFTSSIGTSSGLLAEENDHGMSEGKGARHSPANDQAVAVAPLGDLQTILDTVAADSFGQRPQSGSPQNLFGLELPPRALAERQQSDRETFRTKEDADGLFAGDARESNGQYEFDPLLLPHDASVKHLASETSPLLSSMPPEIAEIVRTRPDLVKQVLEARRKRQQQLNSGLENQVPLVPSSIGQLRVAGDCGVRSGAAETTVPGDMVRGVSKEGDDSAWATVNDLGDPYNDDSGERTELLRRRGGSAAQYRSIQ